MRLNNLSSIYSYNHSNKIKTKIYSHGLSRGIPHKARVSTSTKNSKPSNQVNQKPQGFLQDTETNRHMPHKGSDKEEHPWVSKDYLCKPLPQPRTSYVEREREVRTCESSHILLLISCIEIKLLNNKQLCNENQNCKWSFLPQSFTEM